MKPSKPSMDRGWSSTLDPDDIDNASIRDIRCTLAALMASLVLCPAPWCGRKYRGSRLSLVGCTNELADCTPQRRIRRGLQQQGPRKERGVGGGGIIGQESLELRSRAVAFPGFPQLSLRRPPHGGGPHLVHHDSRRRLRHGALQFREGTHHPWYAYGISSADRVYAVSQFQRAQGGRIPPRRHGVEA